MTTDNICFYMQNRLIQTSQTGGEWYSDASPFSIPWLEHGQTYADRTTLARVFNFRKARMLNSVAIQLNVELKTRHKQLLGSLSLDIVLPG